MPKPTQRELDEAWSAYDYDEEDEALLRHIFDEDALPQGLHQRGYKPFGEPTPEEDEIVSDWKYPITHADELEELK